MANSDISKYHGEVSKCNCGLADHPENIGERACKFCFGRGFVAQCTACNGVGQIDQKMAGGPGMMKSTCIPCGGVGFFGVNRPQDWVEPAKAAAAPAQEEIGASAA